MQSMKVILTGVFALWPLASAQIAEAAAPKVSGKYALMIYDLCQTRFFTNFDNFSRPSKPAAPAVISVQPEINGFGALKVRVGLITFPATAASSGQASYNAIVVQGSTAKINHKGNNMGRSTASGTSAFSLTNTTFTFAGTVHDMQVGDIVNGVARTIYAVARPSGGAPPCVTSLMMTKQ